MGRLLSSLGWALTVVLLASAWPREARACSCVSVGHLGFMGDEQIRLPPDAKGILWKVRWSPREEGEDPVPEQFRVEDLTAGQGVEVRVVRLDLPRQKIFRLEPSRGFEPGHRYRFTNTGPQSLAHELQHQDVQIDEHPIPESAFDAVGLRRVGPPERRPVAVAGSGRCSKEVPGVVLAFEWVLPEALAPYRERLQYTPRVGEPGEPPSPWNFKQHSCGEPKITFDDLPAGTVAVFSSGARSRGLDYSRRYELHGDWRFLELGEGAYESVNLEFDLRCELEDPECPVVPPPEPSASGALELDDSMLLWLGLGLIALMGVGGIVVLMVRRPS